MNPAPVHEPQRAAGLLPAEEAWLCRRDVGSTFLRTDSAIHPSQQRKGLRAESDATYRVHQTEARPMLAIETTPELCRFATKIRQPVPSALQVLDNLIATA